MWGRIAGASIAGPPTGPWEGPSAMAEGSCLAGICEGETGLFARVLRDAGLTGSIIISRLNVTELARHAPSLVVCDIDAFLPDPLELIRQIRFVLPTCIIAVYSSSRTKTWALSYHLAGANCILSKEASAAELSDGIREGTISGCFTDVRFDAA